jgi:tetratricopeptide (TPR) repeat protein
MKNYHYLLITAAIVLLNVGFNIALQEIRISDVNSTLSGVNNDEDPHESLTILGRFQLVRSRLRNRDKQQEDYQLEARMQLLANYKEQLASLQLPEEEDWYLFPVRVVVNAVRLIIGKNILTEPSPNDQATLEELERAYILERARRYESANVIYRQVLRKQIPDTWRISVLLHQGFCSAMNHNFQEAREALNTLLRDYPDSSAAGVAKQLVRYIQEFEESWQVVMDQEGDLLEKGKAFFYVLDYQRAQKSLEEFLYKNPRDPRIAQGLYFLGRSKEEQGAVLAAIVDYRGTINLDEDGPWGEAAWIRLYLLGEFYLQDQSLALESQMELQKRGKERIFQKLEPMVEMVKTREIAPVVLENRRLINANIDRQPNSGLRIVELGRNNQSELIDPAELREIFTFPVTDTELSTALVPDPNSEENSVLAVNPNPSVETDPGNQETDTPPNTESENTSSQNAANQNTVNPNISNQDTSNQNISDEGNSSEGSSNSNNGNLENSSTETANNSFSDPSYALNNPNNDRTNQSQQTTTSSETNNTNLSGNPHNSNQLIDVAVTDPDSRVDSSQQNNQEPPVQEDLTPRLSVSPTRGASGGDSGANLYNSPDLPSFPSPFEEDIAESIDQLRQLAISDWWPGSDDFQRIREIEEELLREDLPPGVRAELEEILQTLENRIAEKRSMEATIANLKTQALAYEEAYQAFMASKPDYSTPQTVSFILGGTFLAGTGTTFALSQSIGAELSSTLQISTGIMAGISLVSGAVFWMLDADEGLDKPRLDEVLEELSLVEEEYQSRRREAQSVE